MREKEYSEWMSKQGFDVLRHANCCKIAFNGGWESRQIEVDELQASYHGKMIGHDHHLGKVKKERDELQKRVDAAIYLLPSIKAENDLWGCDQVERQIELLEQALKGGGE